MHVGIAGDALHVAERLLHRLAERDADILGGVMMVDMQVALGLDLDVDARMPRQQIEHVVEKADAGRDRRTRPSPSRSTATSTSVSLVVRLTDALRIVLSGARRAFYQGFEPRRQSFRCRICIAGGQLLNHAVNEGLPAHASLRIRPGRSSGPWHGTTILTVRKGGLVAIGGDGQVSIGQTIVKSNAKKVRRLGSGDVIGGFAGATADAFTLFERLEGKLEQYPGQLMRAAVELAKDWRTDRYLRRLEAMMIVADKDVSLVLTGTGDVLEPEAGIVGDRLRRQLCAGRRARAGRRPARRRGDRAPVARHRRRHLRLHQPQRHRRNVEERLRWRHSLMRFGR